MKTIGFEQSLCNSSSFEQKCLNNTKEIYQHAGKCEYQQNLRDILDSAIVFTPQDVTDENTSFLMTSTPVKKSSARKSLFLFTNIFDV